MSRTIIHPTVLAVYKDKLAALSLDELEDAAGTLEDVGLVDDDDAHIRMSDLPTAVPEIVRREITALSKEYIAVGKRIQAKLDMLYRHVEDALDVAEAKALADRPKCEACHQPLPSKRQR